MGFIGQKENDHAIVDANLSLTRAVANAAARSNVRVVYTSSACVYPDKIQENTDCRPLQEDDAGLPPSDAYGWEKLTGEQLLVFSLGPRLERLRIARLHNVFGPKCAWQSGREKAPAALLRKALAVALAAERPATDGPTSLEVWGDGEQTRTYLFVDDCVDALIRLAEAENDTELAWPLIVNVSSDHVISVNDLAKMALRIASCPDTTIVNADGPQGVRGRNCDFARIRDRLGWTPSTPLEDGLLQTATWIRHEMEASLTGLSSAQQAEQLLEWSKSFTSTAHSPSPTSFAVLLPITSRSHGKGEDFWDSIGSMTAHLAASVRHDPLWPSMHIVLGLDDDDPLLGSHRSGRRRLLTHMRERVCWQGGAGAATASPLQVISLSAYKPGAICDYWEAMTRAANAAGCTHFVLLGDDVHIKTAGWMTAVDAAFSDIAARRGLPPGFGCVAFTDTSFPGFPTFPIVTSVHLEIMDGRLLPPDAFVNQDADPFLFQLYRRWDASVMLPGARLENTIGGSGDARYAKCPATWTGSVLDNAVESAANWLARHPVRRFAAAGRRERRLVVDIAVPTYRCSLELLRPMLQLSAPEGVSLCYIVIVDRPRHEVGAFLESLEAEFGHDWRYRIRCQGVNTGASSARNRALAESAAEYVIFLDDDVVPSTDIVKHYVDAFRLHPEARGFAGPTFFPPITTARALGARLAGVTYFWDLPWLGGFPQTMGSKNVKVVPWAVTANVAFRRVHGTSFDLAFPMTGGMCMEGRDILAPRERNKNSLWAHRTGPEGIGYQPTPPTFCSSRRRRRRH
jgi:nucleoside-diphosphate-sugar epimerase